MEPDEKSPSQGEGNGPFPAARVWPLEIMIIAFFASALEMRSEDSELRGTTIRSPLARRQNSRLSLIEAILQSRSSRTR